MKAIVDGLAVEYRDEGQGPMLLLLHGWGNSLDYFDPLCRELEGFRLVRVNMPGFGGSERRKEAWTVSEYADFVRDFCEKLNVKPDVLIGHSFGGRIIMKGVAEHVLEPQKIVLIAAAGVAKRWNMRNSAYALVAKVGKETVGRLPGSIPERMKRALYHRAGSDYLNVHGMSDTFLSVVGEDLSEYAKRIHVPTLIIWGTKDDVTPLSEGRDLHRFIQGSTLHELDGGHFIYQERPEEVARLIREFI